MRRNFYYIITAVITLVIIATLCQEIYLQGYYDALEDVIIKAADIL